MDNFFVQFFEGIFMRVEIAGLNVKSCKINTKNAMKSRKSAGGIE